MKNFLIKCAFSLAIVIIVGFRVFMPSPTTEMVLWLAACVGLLAIAFFVSIKAAEQVAEERARSEKGKQSV
ncbi:MAG: hypothetical protein KA045_02320 [Burkholderiaceae bacterium]|jgi:hypothetical protein|nr:hypothetical protein [Burkholderiaceae bacterium]